MQMPPEPLEKDFYDELLIAMGAVVSVSSSMVSVRSRARTFARQFGLRLLIIDEIHAMLAGTFRQQRIFLNSIRFLANDLHLPLLCVGTQEAHQALLTDQQLADRFAAFELPRWQDDAAFAQLLKTFAAMLPLHLSSDLCQPKIRQRILSLTEGITVRICRVLEAAAIAAITDGTERIDLDHVQRRIGGVFFSVDIGSPAEEGMSITHLIGRRLEPGGIAVCAASNQWRVAEFLGAAAGGGQRHHLPEMCACVGDLLGGREQAAVFDYGAPKLWRLTMAARWRGFQNDGYGCSISSSSFRRLAASGSSTIRHGRNGSFPASAPNAFTSRRPPARSCISRRNGPWRW